MTGIRRMAALAATLAALGFVALTAVLRGPEAAFKNEWGAVEHASVAVLLALAAALALAGRRLGRFGFVPAIVLLLALREMDFHNWFHDPGFLQMRVFASDAPLWVKLLGAATMLAILALLALLVLRGTRPVLAGLRRRKSWALVLAGCAALAALAVLLDGPDRTAASLGLALSPGAAFALGALEETLELAFALGLVWVAALVPGRDRDR